MKTLTICQPYAELILLGEKRVENRTWSTRYRGPLLIHAGKSRAWLSLPGQALVTAAGGNPDRLDFGAVVGRCVLRSIVSLTAIRRGSGLAPDYRWLSTHEHCEGPYCWVLDEVQRLERPVPWRGKGGLWDLDKLAIEMAFEGPAWLPAGPPPRRCRVCGCTDHSPCFGGHFDAVACHWIADDLCSQCR